MEPFARNVVHFVRLLRGAGLGMSPAHAVDALDALRFVDLNRRDDVRATLACLLVHASDEREIFDAAFDLFWRDPDWEGKLRALLLPKVTNGMPPPLRNNRLADALAARAACARDRREPPSKSKPEEAHARVTFSSQERLSHRDFDTLSADEWRKLRHQIRAHRLPLATEPTRRLKAASRGTHADLKASARHAVRSGGDWTVWKYRAALERRPPLVLLLDISGSMSAYSRAVLYFCHALLQSRERLQVFLFGTRLTNATRALRERDPDVAIATLGQNVADWSGGTRIGAALAEFNRRWARRVLGGRATVLLVTDGLDHEAIDVLDAEMQRLRRFAHRLVWLNPLLRFADFTPRARGVRAILPHVDAMLAAHNLDSLGAVGRELAALSRRSAPHTLLGDTRWN
ncbi:vWA domain-containing protein [Caballeronia ptereochthonis]|uniref:VWA domain containing CoxE-like protein n=1 Tax=Caballeronia ptereochthonis TaxID=1777144 RepID=A0A158BV52_9BURK|nr:VWA domain-containing protein [Caballeronia ptereochthonis]SAK73556.1 VWA domain containing CoxE-like protein [Caballeronia ptereochthonis]